MKLKHLLITFATINTACSEKDDEKKPTQETHEQSDETIEDKDNPTTQNSANDTTNNISGKSVTGIFEEDEDAKPTEENDGIVPLYKSEYSSFSKTKFTGGLLPINKLSEDGNSYLYGLANDNFETIVEPTFANIRRCFEGHCSVVLQEKTESGDYKYALINQAGETLFQHDAEIRYLGSGISAIKNPNPDEKLNKYALVDSTKTNITDYKFYEVGVFYNDLARVAYSNDVRKSYAIINTKAEETIKNDVYDDIDCLFDSEFCYTIKNNTKSKKAYIIKRTGEVIKEFTLHDSIFAHFRAVQVSENRFNVRYEYTKGKYYRDGVKNNQRFEQVDINGNTLYSFTYDDSDFKPILKQEDLSVLTLDGNSTNCRKKQLGRCFGLANLKGEILIPAVYERLWFVKKDLYIAKSSKKGIFLNRQGETQDFIPLKDGFRLYQRHNNLHVFSYTFDDREVYDDEKNLKLSIEADHFFILKDNLIRIEQKANKLIEYYNFNGEKLY